MKNHIKNYIKIIGLAAVPFGTAQATDYEIKVTQEHKPDAEHFKISVPQLHGGGSGEIEIVWAHGKECPDPIFKNGGVLWKWYGGRLNRKVGVCFESCLKKRFLQEEVSAHVLDWINFYRHDDASKIVEDEKALKDLIREYFPCLDSSTAERIREEVLKLGKKSRQEVVKDAAKKHKAEYHVKPRKCKSDYHFCHATNFPEACSYECYYINGMGGDIRLLLVKDAHHVMSKSTYTLVIFCFYTPPWKGGLRVISDISTVYFDFDMLSTYCATNEVLDKNVRRNFADLVRIYKHGASWQQKKDVILPVDNFIRIRRHANELPLTGGIAEKNAVDITCGRVSDAWRGERHMNDGFCSYVTGKNAFKDPLEAVLHVERFLKSMDNKRFHKRRPGDVGTVLRNMFTSEY